MTDTFNVTASFDKTSYTTGETMTITITGDDVMTETAPQTVSGTITLTAADGATSTLEFPSGTTVNVSTSTNEAVKMTAITDSSGRTWTIAANGLTATATA